MNKEEIISKYKLNPHPEGGFYLETYRSKLDVSVPYDTENQRSISTAIYFLLGKNNVSHLHRIKADEMWHFYDGLPLNVLVLDHNNPCDYEIIRLGRDLDKGQVFQAVVPANKWFGAFIDDNDKLNNQYDFSLVGCTVSPGFHFKDFELGSADMLINSFPKAENMIRKLT